MNLENGIKDIIGKKLEDGTIEKLVSEQLELGIKRSLEDILGHYGDVTKIIEKKIKEVMIPYLESYDYSQYIVKLDSVLVDVLKDSTLENRKLLENFKELMTIEENLKDIKITQIYKKWCEYCTEKIDSEKIDGYDYEGGYINTSLDVEEVSSDWSNYEKHIVRFECEEDKDLNIEFILTRWKEFDKTHRLDWKKTNELSSLKHLNKFDMFMMKIDQAFSKIEIDDSSTNDEIFIEYKE
ncbi:hypothetical protein [Clostridium sp. CF012]|uniref:hypothetical protein n=1 Tax=Clostridium sp. CF012 TaxID=2843319 RepID=UPI00209A9774|nr:hypothetical protein [Clostridium sp. CF012]